MIDITLQPDEKLIQLIAKEVTAVKTKLKFTAFSAVQKDKRLIDCKFTNACPLKPVQSCYIHVKVSDINIDRNRLYPVLWVRNVLGIYVDDTEKEAKDARDAADIDDAF